jgi:hypothetical protein
MRTTSGKVYGHFGVKLIIFEVPTLSVGTVFSGFNGIFGMIPTLSLVFRTRIEQSFSRVGREQGYRPATKYSIFQAAHHIQDHADYVGQVTLAGLNSEPEVVQTALEEQRARQRCFLKRTLNDDNVGSHRPKKKNRKASYQTLCDVHNMLAPLSNGLLTFQQPDELALRGPAIGSPIIRRAIGFLVHGGSMAIGRLRFLSFATFGQSTCSKRDKAPIDALL